MFYSHFHLQKRGPFGLIWLAATNSKVLTKREILAVNIMGSCKDIIQHIPLPHGQNKPAKRFSLYLCCQLLYGSVKVFLQQWDVLLLDVYALYGKLRPKKQSGKKPDVPNRPINGYSADLPVLPSSDGPEIKLTLKSRIPENECDPIFDPLFGALKDPTPDIETFLNALDQRDGDQLTFERLPPVVQPEVGSPHSVSHPRDIQILDPDVTQLSVMLPDEHDLPGMDPAGLQELLSPEPAPPVQERIKDEQEQQTFPASQAMAQSYREEFERPALFQDTAQELQDIHPQDMTLQEGSLLPNIGALEETPLSKPASDMPAPPKKPRPGKTRKTKPPIDAGIGEQKDDNRQDILQVEERQISDSVVDVPRIPQVEEGQVSDRVVYVQLPVMEGEVHPRADAEPAQEQRSPQALHLSPIIPDQSPLRKRRPHKLIIDSSIIISRPEMRQQIENSEDIISPLNIDFVTYEKRRKGAALLFQEPAEKVLSHSKTLRKLFTRNCKFGLLVDDGGSERDIGSSADLLDAINKQERTRRFEEQGSPTPKFPRSLELPSVELGRDASSRFSHVSAIERNLSHSIIVPSGDESVPSIRHHPGPFIDRETSSELNSMALQDISADSAQLPMWLEEPELNLNAVPDMRSSDGKIQQDLAQNDELLAPCPDYQQFVPDISVNGTSEINVQNLDQEAHWEGILMLVQHHLRTKDDITTFRTICPPCQYSRNAAASFLVELCYLVSKQQVRVRQDQPYGEIFIWLHEQKEHPAERDD